MSITIGQVYYGPHDEQQLVIAVDGDTVQLMHPTTSQFSTIAVADFDAWRLASDRRSYPVDADGVRRIRRRRYNDDDGQAMVEWSTVENKSAIAHDTAEDWAAWRKTVAV